jgi:hypothetical protein
MALERAFAVKYKQWFNSDFSLSILDPDLVVHANMDEFLDDVKLSIKPQVKISASANINGIKSILSN